MRKRLGHCLGGAGIALLALSGGAMAADVEELEDALAIDQLMVEESEEYGEYLVTEDGRSVYMFEADSEGESACYDDCATAWPPLTPMDGTPDAGENVDEEMIDTIERDDGIDQVTYGDQPLYAFVRDTEAGETSGHDIEGFGGEWYLVSPDGGMAGGHATNGGGDDSEAVGSDAEAGEPDASERATEDTNGTNGADVDGSVGTDPEAGEPDASERATEEENGTGEADVNGSVGTDPQAGEPEASEEATD